MSNELDYICSFFLCCCVTIECIVSICRARREVEYNEIENVIPDVVNQSQPQSNQPFIFEIVTNFDHAKSLYDQNSQTNCIICMDELKSEHSVVECLQCNKYVGHQECIQKWIDIQEAKYNSVKCPHCRSSEAKPQT